MMSGEIPKRLIMSSLRVDARVGQATSASGALRAAPHQARQQKFGIKVCLAPRTTMVSTADGWIGVKEDLMSETNQRKVN
jgi:hypothetical protein